MEWPTHPLLEGGGGVSIIIIMDTWFILVHSGSFLPQKYIFIFNSLYIK